jgi:hypothetical protein
MLCPLTPSRAGRIHFANVVFDAHAARPERVLFKPSACGAGREVHQGRNGDKVPITKQL